MCDSYLNTDNEMTTGVQAFTFPAVLRCLNGQCSGYQREYIAWKEHEKPCPHCKLQGSWVRILSSGKANKFQCGACLRIMWLPPEEWPVGHYGWGHIQLNNKSPFTYICINCMREILEKFPKLRSLGVDSSPAEVTEEVLPKIIQPSKLLIPKDG